MLSKHKKRLVRKIRVRKKIFWTSAIPRLSVYRSNRFIYVQVIDDQKGVTLCSASDHKMEKTGTKMEMSRLIGEIIAEKCLSLNIKKIVFDRWWNLYFWRVRSLAQGARDKWLSF